ncbi:MAG: hypothetical protein FJ298_10825, partial [Planctomycetes bacterium]|nr:hypothetical protein [Planctomycetota bacterium]
ASATAVTGFGTTARALGAGLPLLALALAGVASQMVAGELARGTLRNVLLRPQTRLDVLLGKTLAGCVALAASYALLVLAAVGLSGAFFGFGSLVEVLPNGQEFLLVEAQELQPLLLRALLVPLAALAGYLAVGLLAGTLARAAAAALGLAIGFAFTLDLARVALRGVGVEGGLLSAYLPSPLGDTSYLQFLAESAQGISNPRREHAALWCDFLPQDVGVPALWALACLALSIVLLARRPIP